MPAATGEAAAADLPLSARNASLKRDRCLSALHSERAELSGDFGWGNLAPRIRRILPLFFSWVRADGAKA
jgi:hypothetical protein